MGESEYQWAQKGSPKYQEGVKKGIIKPDYVGKYSGDKPVSSTVVRSGGGGSTSSPPPTTPSSTTETRYVYVNPEGATHVYTEKPENWERMVGKKQVVSATVPSGTSESQLTEGMRRFVKEGESSYSYTVQETLVTKEPPASFTPDVISSQEARFPASFEEGGRIRQTLLEREAQLPVRQGTVGEVSRMQAEADRRSTETLLTNQSAFSRGIDDFLGLGSKIQTAPERAILKMSPYLPSPIKELASSSAQLNIARSEFGAGATSGAITAIPSIPSTITAVTTRPVETGQAFVEQIATRPAYTLGSIAGSTLVLGKVTSTLRPTKTPTYEVKYLSSVEQTYDVGSLRTPAYVVGKQIQGKPFGDFTSETFVPVRTKGGVIDRTLFDVKEVQYDFIQPAKPSNLNPKITETVRGLTGKYTTTKPPEVTQGFQLVETGRAVVHTEIGETIKIGRQYVPVEKPTQMYQQFPRSTKTQGKPFEFKPPPSEVTGSTIKTSPIKSTGGGSAEVKLTPRQIQSRPVLEVTELPLTGRVSTIDAFRGLSLGQPTKTFTGQGSSLDQFTGQGQSINLRVDSLMDQKQNQMFKTDTNLRLDQTPQFKTMSFVNIGFDTTTRQSQRMDLVPAMSFDLGFDFGSQPRTPIQPPKTRPQMRPTIDLPPVEYTKTRRGKKRGRGYYERTYGIDPRFLKMFG